MFLMRRSRKAGFFAMIKARQATLNAIVARPTKADILWSAIESLIRALGGEVTEARREPGCGKIEQRDRRLSPAAPSA
jgi:hypothetical protein